MKSGSDESAVRADFEAFARENWSTLLPMLRTLPSRQRAVLVLRYLCDLPDDEIAETLGIGLGSVRSQAHRGLATLRKSSHTSFQEALR